MIDADGLWVTPGFIDVHTHYDAQLHFEPTCSPSSWHGVTTVFTGNCGFTFAPARSAEDLDWLLAMLSRVEGMSPDGLKEGVSYRGGSFRDFLDGLSSSGIGVNVAANVGHCALRRWVMGDEASERAATDDEVAQMCALLRTALADGAVGFTSSQLDLHVAHDGRPVPSNLAAPEELVALAAAAGDAGAHAIEFIPRTFLPGYDDADRELILKMCRASGLPVSTNTLSKIPHSPDGWKRSLEFAEEAAGRAARPAAVRGQPSGRALLARHDVPLRRVRHDAVVPDGDERSPSNSCAIRVCATSCASSWPTGPGSRSCSCRR